MLRNGCWLLLLSTTTTLEKEAENEHFAVGYILSSDYTIVVCVCTVQLHCQKTVLLPKKKHFISFENLTMQQQSLVENSIKVTLNLKLWVCERKLSDKDSLSLKLQLKK